jgi:hypothetical protein
MDHYDFAEICHNSFGVHIRSTDSSEVENLLSQLKLLIPNMRLQNNSEMMMWRIEEAKSKTIDPLWWLVKQLCSHGWKPLGATSDEIGVMHYHFGRKFSS